MLLTAVRSRRSPTLIPCDCKSARQRLSDQFCTVLYFFTRSPRSTPFPQLLPDLDKCLHLPRARKPGVDKTPILTRLLVKITNRCHAKVCEVVTQFLRGPRTPSIDLRNQDFSQHAFVRHSRNRNESRISTQHDREKFLIDRIALVIMVIATIGTFDREIFRQFGWICHLYTVASLSPCCSLHSNRLTAGKTI